jgi:hypothetical protein
LRLPRGYIVYDEPVTPRFQLKECLKKLREKQVIFTKEPIYLLGTLYRRGSVILYRKYFVIGKDAVVVEKDFCSLPHIRIELDAWGECLKRVL